MAVVRREDRIRQAATRAQTRAASAGARPLHRVDDVAGAEDEIESRIRKGRQVASRPGALQVAAGGRAGTPPSQANTRRPRSGGPAAPGRSKSARCRPRCRERRAGERRLVLEQDDRFDPGERVGTVLALDPRPVIDPYFDGILIVLLGWHVRPRVDNPSTPAEPRSGRGSPAANRRRQGAPMAVDRSHLAHRRRAREAVVGRIQVGAHVFDLVGAPLQGQRRVPPRYPGGDFLERPGDALGAPVDAFAMATGAARFVKRGPRSTSAASAQGANAPSAMGIIDASAAVRMSRLTRMET